MNLTEPLVQRQRYAECLAHDLCRPRRTGQVGGHNADRLDPRQRVPRSRGLRQPTHRQLGIQLPLPNPVGVMRRLPVPEQDQPPGAGRHTA